MCDEESGQQSGQLSHYPTLRLRYGEEMSIREIAEKLGVCERTVNRRIAREIASYLEERPHLINAIARLHLGVAYQGSRPELTDGG